VPSYLIAVFFGLQRGDEVYPRPHFLAREFAATCQHFRSYISRLESLLSDSRRVLVLSDTLSNSPESVGHECRGSEKVCGGAKASYGQVALVLYGAVAARWRHILRHVGRVLVAQWVFEVVVDAETCSEVRAREPAMTGIWLGALASE